MSSLFRFSIGKQADFVPVLHGCLHNHHHVLTSLLHEERNVKAKVLTNPSLRLESKIQDHNFYFVCSVHLVALGLIQMMLLCMIVKPVGLVDRIEMRKTDCFGKTRLCPHVPSSS